MSYSGRGAITARAALAAAGAVLLLSAAAGTAFAQRDRPFEHRRHETISCRSCHGTGAEHRTPLIRSARDCAACHHDERRAKACVDCHDAGEIPARPVRAALSFAASPAPRTRPLPFRHDVHLQPGKAVVCKDCHGTPVTLAVNRDCASCHAQHHRPEAECTSCHVKAPAGTHTDRVHLSCSGSGCHAAPVAPSPTFSRTLCLACHAEKREHEPQGDCAACHRIPSSRRASSQRDAGLPAIARQPPW